MKWLVSIWNGKLGWNKLRPTKLLESTGISCPIQDPHKGLAAKYLEWYMSIMLSEHLYQHFSRSFKSHSWMHGQHVIKYKNISLLQRCCYWILPKCRSYMIDYFIFKFFTVTVSTMNRVFVWLHFIDEVNILKTHKIFTYISWFIYFCLMTTYEGFQHFQKQFPIYVVQNSCSINSQKNSKNGTFLKPSCRPFTCLYNGNFNPPVS